MGMDVPLSRPPVRANAQEEWHGTNYGYNGKACRCELCTTNHAAEMRDYNARKAQERALLYVDMPTGSAFRVALDVIQAQYGVRPNYRVIRGVPVVQLAIPAEYLRDFS